MLHKLLMVTASTGIVEPSVWSVLLIEAIFRLVFFLINIVLNL